MEIYKLIFAKNNLLTCKEVDNDTYSFDGLYHYEHINGVLIYAIVKADSEQEALTYIDIIHKEIYEIMFGIDFVN